MVEAEGDCSMIQWTPAEADQIRQLASAGKTPYEAAKILGRTRQAVIGFTWRNGIKWEPRPLVDPKDSVPRDFPRLYMERSYKDLCFTYSRSVSTIKKWAALLGLRKKRQSMGRAPRVRRPTLYAPRNVRTTAAWRPTLTGKQPIDRPHRDETPAGQAADYLRRFGPVIRCNAQGQYDQYGDHWLRGSSILTADEIIDRAERNGWTAWRLAA